MDFSKGNRGNNKYQVNVNTRGIQLMNKEGFDPSTVILGFWNEMVSIKMHPALEPSKQTSSSVYDYETTFSTVLTVEKAQLLYSKMNELIYPAIKEGRDESIGVQIGDDALVIVSTGVKQFGEVKPFLGIFKGLDERKKAETMICFEFKQSEDLIRDYDPSTGEHEKVKGCYPHLDLFNRFLNVAINAMMHAEAHSVRFVDKFFRDKLLEAAGASTGTISSYGGGSSTRNVFEDKTSNNYEPEVSKENVGDINSFLQ